MTWWCARAFMYVVAVTLLTYMRCEEKGDAIADKRKSNSQKEHAPICLALFSLFDLEKVRQSVQFSMNGSCHAKSVAESDLELRCFLHRIYNCVQYHDSWIHS